MRKICLALSVAAFCLPNVALGGPFTAANAAPPTKADADAAFAATLKVSNTTDLALVKAAKGLKGLEMVISGTHDLYMAIMCNITAEDDTAYAGYRATANQSVTAAATSQDGAVSTQVKADNLYAFAELAYDAEDYGTCVQILAMATVQYAVAQGKYDEVQSALNDGWTAICYAGMIVANYIE